MVYKATQIPWLFRLAANLMLIGDIRKDEDEKVSCLWFNSSLHQNCINSQNCAVQEMLDKYRKSRVKASRVCALLGSVSHWQGSVAALKKKTHRDKMEAQAELERTKEWVLQKEKGMYNSAHTLSIRMHHYVSPICVYTILFLVFIDLLVLIMMYSVS